MNRIPSRAHHDSVQIRSDPFRSVQIVRILFLTSPNVRFIVHRSVGVPPAKKKGKHSKQANAMSRNLNPRHMSQRMAKASVGGRCAPAAMIVNSLVVDTPNSDTMVAKRQINGHFPVGRDPMEVPD